MTNTSIYANLAASVLTTMLFAHLHPVVTVGCLLWMTVAAVQAHKAGAFESRE